MLKKEKNKKKIIMWSIFGLLVLAFIIWVIIINIKANGLNYTISKEEGKTIYTIENYNYAESEEETNFVLI